MNAPEGWKTMVAFETADSGTATALTTIVAFVSEGAETIAFALVCESHRGRMTMGHRHFCNWCTFLTRSQLQMALGRVDNPILGADSRFAGRRIGAVVRTHADSGTTLFSVPALDVRARIAFPLKSHDNELFLLTRTPLKVTLRRVCNSICTANFVLRIVPTVWAIVGTLALWRRRSDNHAIRVEVALHFLAALTNTGVFDKERLLRDASRPSHLAFVGVGSTVAGAHLHQLVRTFGTDTSWFTVGHFAHLWALAAVEGRAGAHSTSSLMLELDADLLQTTGSFHLTLVLICQTIGRADRPNNHRALLGTLTHSFRLADNPTLRLVPTFELLASIAMIFTFANLPDLYFALFFAGCCPHNALISVSFSICSTDGFMNKRALLAASTSRLPIQSNVAAETVGTRKALAGVTPSIVLDGDVRRRFARVMSQMTRRWVIDPIGRADSRRFERVSIIRAVGWTDTLGREDTVSL